MVNIQVRHLNLHEYQSKNLMSKYNVRVQKGLTASTPEEAEAAAKKLLAEGAKELVIKAQVHAGGRGKGHFTNGFKVRTQTDIGREVGGAHIERELQTLRRKKDICA